jgi:hypothetical protein
VQSRVRRLQRKPLKRLPDTLNTNTNCGSCGAACSLANATSTCATGTCEIQSCNSGWGNCDGVTANGCETSLTTLTNCGSCGAACSLANATATCATGACEIASCDSGWGNCDGNTANGCETQLNSDTNCGGCGVSCTVPNGTGTCATGTCEVASCNSGYDYCDGPGNVSLGCELNHTTSLNSCATATYLGEMCGDLTCNWPLCGSTSSQLLGTGSGTDTVWFSAIDESCSICDDTNQHIVSLKAPAGASYQVCIYFACGGAPSCYNSGTGQTTQVSVYAGATTFTYWIEVQYVSGFSCSPWTLTVDGTNC